MQEDTSEDDFDGNHQGFIASKNSYNSDHPSDESSSMEQIYSEFEDDKFEPT